MNIRGLTVAVTGCEGLVGKNLCLDLVRRGARVLGIDKTERDWGDLEPYHFYNFFMKHNLLSSEPWPAEGLVVPDLIIHLAAHARVDRLVENTALAWENMKMFFPVLEWAKHKRIPIILASSREIYGDTRKVVCSEGDVSVDTCCSPYAAGKILTESMLRAYSNCYHFPFVILRLSNVYGPYDYMDRFVPLLITQARSGLPISIYGSQKVVDFTYVEDVVRGFVSAIVNFEASAGEAFNVSSGQGVSLLDAASQIVMMMNSNSMINVFPARAGEIERFVGDITKAEKLLGYEPCSTLRGGLMKTMSWYKDNSEKYSKFSGEYCACFGRNSNL